MADVIAKERGYFGGAIREAGERFSVPDEIWGDEARRPRWADAVASEPEPASLSAPAAGRIAKARAKAQVGKPEGAGVTEALGGPHPDWLPPETV